MNIWNGSIGPWVSKSIGTVRFIPLAQMDAEAWKILDFGALRETAINRLEQKARGKLIGFFEVNILQKAGPSKSRYYVPVTREDLDEWEEGESPEYFENSADGDLSPEATAFNNLISALALAIILGGVAAVVEALTDDTTSCSIGDEDEAQIQELLDLLADGAYFDNLDAADSALAIALYLYGKCPVDFLLRVIEILIEELENNPDEF